MCLREKTSIHVCDNNKIKKMRIRCKLKGREDGQAMQQQLPYTITSAKLLLRPLLRPLPPLTRGYIYIEFSDLITGKRTRSKDVKMGVNRKQLIIYLIYS